MYYIFFFFFFQAEDGIRDVAVTGVQTCALPIYDGVLDHAIDVQTGTWPIAFRVVVNSTTPAAFELLNAPSELRFFDAHGGLTWSPNALSAGTTLNLKIR